MCLLCDFIAKLTEEISIPEFGFLIVHRGEAKPEDVTLYKDEIRDGILSGKWILFEDPTDFVDPGQALMIPCVSRGVPEWPLPGAPTGDIKQAAIAATILIKAGFLNFKDVPSE